jgi:hypothetical protein
MERLRSVVESELGRFGPAAGMADVVTGWPDAVGEAIARNAWPARIGRDGTLFVHTADAVWAFELQHRAEEIAARAGVERIRFMPGPVPQASLEEPPTLVASPLEVSERDRLQAAAITAGIDDPELREVVSRAVAASLARAASGRPVW